RELLDSKGMAVAATGGSGGTVRWLALRRKSLTVKEGKRNT
ncbi:hypothetical protein A2U01_0068502, partial [Trifolium medium]|nr:hypothetical protein [Trifolium medium]